MIYFVFLERVLAINQYIVIRHMSEAPRRGLKKISQMAPAQVVDDIAAVHVDQAAEYEER
jgi:hypothetical protein